MPGSYFLNFDMKDVATFTRFYDSGGLLFGNPAFAPKNWGANGSVPLGGGSAAYYFNGQNTGSTFYPNDGTGGAATLVAFSFTSDDNPTVWNSGDMSANVVLSGGNLTAAANSTANGGVRATSSRTTGKVYFEVTTGGTIGNAGVGIGTASSSLTTGSANEAYLNVGNGTVFINGASPGIASGAFASGNTACVAIDFGNARIWWRLNNNVWNNNGLNDPGTNVGGFDISAVFPANAAFPLLVFVSNNTTTFTANFGAAAFLYPMPTGFSAWGGGSGGLTPGTNNDAINVPSAGGYTAQGISFGRNRAGAVTLPAGSLLSNAGLITGWIDPTGMRAGGSPSANVISILKPFASGHVANVQGLIITLNPTNQITITVDFFNLPTVGGTTVAQFRITGNLPAAPFPIYGFPLAVQWNFAGNIWKAQLVFALLNRADGTYHYDTTTTAIDSTGASLRTANQGECNAGSPLAPAYQLFNGSILYFNCGPNAWLGDPQGGAAYPSSHQPVQGTVYPPGTDVGFGAGLAPYHNVTFNYGCQYAQWMITPQPQATVAGSIFARRER